MYELTLLFFFSISAVLDVKGLKAYLVENGFPLVVMLVEDGTKIQQHAQHDSRSDCLTGCVPPFDEAGMPRVDYFKATSAYAVKKHLESSRLADTAYVQLAVPLAPEAAPYVLFYVGTDNKFSHDDVRRRWKTTKRLLKNEGIKVIGFASDGDPKLLKAMLNETSFLSRLQRSKWGPFFIVNNIPLEHVYIQDIIHLLNKIRNKLLNSKELKFGKP